MVKLKTEKLRLIKQICSQAGIVRTETLRKNGITSRDIKALVDENLLFRIRQGHYIWHEGVDALSDIEIITKLIPDGVLCLFSAVSYYGLSTVNPTEINIALPRNVVPPVLPENLHIKVYRMTDRHFNLGIVEVEVENVMVKMFDMEKTVCDCFKYDKEIEKAIAIEVLKNYIAKGACNIQKLLEYAKIMGKKKTILPYLEAIL